MKRIKYLFSMILAFVLMLNNFGYAIFSTKGLLEIKNNYCDKYYNETNYTGQENCKDEKDAEIAGNMFLTDVRMTNVMGVPIEKSSFMPLGDNKGLDFNINITYSTMYQNSTCSINVGIFDDKTFLNIKSFIFPLVFFTDDGIIYNVKSNDDLQIPKVVSQIRSGKVKYIKIYDKYKYKLLVSPEEKTEAYEQYESKHK